MKISKAKELLKKGEVAVVVFTHGQLFHYDRNGNGQTGNWVTDPDLLDGIDKVIIYLRDDQNEKNKLFIGAYSGNKPSPETGRYIIHFSKLAEVGITEANWFEFADGSQNPVCYVAG